MKKKDLAADIPNRFVGICKTCGEVYEAQSSQEDLEGVTFACQKVMCKGRVSLELSPPASADLTFPNDQAPRRFC